MTGDRRIFNKGYKSEGRGDSCEKGPFAVDALGGAWVILGLGCGQQATENSSDYPVYTLQTWGH